MTSTTERVVRIKDIIRPISCAVDEDVLDYIMNSIVQEGIREPIDLVEYDGRLYGFNGCHRCTAADRLGYTEIPARVKQIDQQTFNSHF
jgi:uncharacterized ParB-like nuclease family protein